MDYDLSVTIRRPPGAIWAVLADIQEYADAPGSPVPEMEKIPTGPTRVGTRWREVVRLAPGVTMTVWSEATAVEPDRRLELDWHGPWMTGHIAYTVEPVDGGTVLRQLETVTPHGPLRLVSGPMDRVFRPQLEKRLRDIRELLETGTASATG